MTDPTPRPGSPPSDVLLDEPPGGGQAPAAAGFAESMVGVLRRPAATFRGLAARQPLGQALAVVVAVTALLAVVQAIGLARDPDAPLQVLPAAIVGGLLIGLPLALASFAVWTALVLGCARLLGGGGTFRGTLTGLGFAYVPLALGVLAAAVSVPFGPAGGGLLVTAFLGATLWSFVLDVFAVREVHGLGTGRAIGALLLPVVFFVIVVVLVVTTLFTALVTTT